MISLIELIIAMTYTNSGYKPPETTMYCLYLILSSKQSTTSHGNWYQLPYSRKDSGDGWL